MPNIFGMIISHKLATLKDIKDYYNYDECLDLLDIILTDNYNKTIINNNMKAKNGK